MKELLYIAGPYSSGSKDGVLRNIRTAEVVALCLWQHGYPTICPHKNTAGFEGLAPYHMFIEGDLKIVERCDAVVMLAGWEESPGATVEHDHAIKEGKQVYYWPQDAAYLLGR